MAIQQISSLHKLARQLLKKLGNANPTNEQLVTLINLLPNSIMQAQLLVEPSLTQQERECLLLAACGNSIKKTAKIMELSMHTIKDHRKGIMRKLGCVTMAQAVYQGTRYGYLVSESVLP